MGEANLAWDTQRLIERLPIKIQSWHWAKVTVVVNFILNFSFESLERLKERKFLPSLILWEPRNRKVHVLLLENIDLLPQCTLGQRYYQTNAGILPIINPQSSGSIKTIQSGGKISIRMKFEVCDSYFITGLVFRCYII